MNDPMQKGFSLFSYLTNALTGLFGLFSPNTWLVIVSVFFSGLTWFCNFYYQKRRESRVAAESVRDAELKEIQDRRNAELHALEMQLKQAQLKKLGE